MDRCRSGAALCRFAQRVEQAAQAVVIHLLHQRKQPADFARRESFACEPVEVVPGQIGDKPAFVFAEGHGERDEAFEIGALHAGIVPGFPYPHIVKPAYFVAFD